MAETGPLRIVVKDDVDTITVDPETGDVTEMKPGGGAVVRFGAQKAGLGQSDDVEWFGNLIDKLDATKLSVIVNDLIDGIKADDQSRQGWLQNTTKGLELLGLQLENPSTNVESTGDGPVMAKVKNPLLLEACLKGWANAEAELLPAAGPVKIESAGDETSGEDDQAEMLERGMNHYLTTTAREYYPETSHMLLWGTYFRGSGFKKVYRCPRRRRPVSEMVEAKDLIVSTTTKGLRACGRITHQIEMRPSVFKLMQLIGAYRKTSGAQPNPEPNVVDNKIAAIQGTESTPSRPEDKPYTVWETQCELDLDQFIPNGSKFKGQGIPLPYLVSIDKDNEECLSLRRDWHEDDIWCSRIRMYVKYPYVPGPGFYGTGMLNILGNSSAALTAAWREALNTGMFANFPGGFIDKKAVRGNNNTTFTMGPGEFVPIEAGNQPIKNMIADLPYKDVTPGLLQLIDKITEQSKMLGQGAEIPAGEGVKDIPVGSMLSQIEQSTKIMAAAHKGMHAAQSEEIELLVDLFRRHPEDLTTSDPNSPLKDWPAPHLLQALQNVKLVPVSDPNIPSHIHRVAKALGLIQLLPVFPQELDRMEVLKRTLAAMREDPTGLISPNAGAPPPPDPEVEVKMQEAQTKDKKVNADIASKGADNALKLQELQSDQAIHAMDMQKEQVIHSADAQKAQLDAKKVQADVVAKHASLDQAEVDSKRKTGTEMLKAGLAAHQQAQDHALGIADHVLERQKAAHDATMQTQQAANQTQQTAVQTHQALNPPQPAAKKPKGKK